MAQVVYSAGPLAQLERAFELLRTSNTPVVERAVRAIVSAIENLANHPLTGRRIDGEIRELIISFGESGFLALYEFVVPRDEVRVLAIARQRELGYLP